MVFLVREGGGFSGCPAGHNPVRPVVDLPFDEIAERPFINLAVSEGVTMATNDPLNMDILRC